MKHEEGVRVYGVTLGLESDSVYMECWECLACMKLEEKEKQDDCETKGTFYNIADIIRSYH